MDGQEICLWMDRRELAALTAALKERGQEDRDAALRDMLRAFYEQTVPEATRQAIAREISAEELARDREREASRRRSGIVFRQDGVTAFYESNTAFDDLSMALLIRRHVRDELDGSLDSHFDVRADGLISQDAMRSLIEMRIRNSAVVTGVFLIDLDKDVYGTLQAMEGWRFYPLRAVSSAIYRANRSAHQSFFHRLSVYWAQLVGKALPQEEYMADIKL